MIVEYKEEALKELIHETETVSKELYSLKESSSVTYSDCVEKFERLFAQLEEQKQECYEKLEDAESREREAQEEYESARKALESQGEQADSYVVSRFQSASGRLSIARQEVYLAEENYRAVERKINALMQYKDVFDASAGTLKHIIESQYLLLSGLIKKGNDGLNQYILLMKKARHSLQETSIQSGSGGSIGGAGFKASSLEWSGEVNNSLRVPHRNEDLSRTLNEYGVNGIEYVDGTPDFSPVSKFVVEFSENELFSALGNIPIGKLMSEDGFVNRKKFNTLVRAEWQKIALNTILNRLQIDADFRAEFCEKVGIDPSMISTSTDLANAIKTKGLTLHESTDCKNILFVPTKIHGAFTHSGGVSAMLERLISGNYKALHWL
ncbi:MAG: HNH endonuclease [Lachnospiraceae bacterium]|nr:HNH endonuclease [Lachnospiraceae bacterium]